MTDIQCLYPIVKFTHRDSPPHPTPCPPPPSLSAADPGMGWGGWNPLWLHLHIDIGYWIYIYICKCTHIFIHRNYGVKSVHWQHEITVWPTILFCNVTVCVAEHCTSVPFVVCFSYFWKHRIDTEHKDKTNRPVHGSDRIVVLVLLRCTNIHKVTHT